jgi:uncharacterized protein YegL
MRVLAILLLWAGIACAAPIRHAPPDCRRVDDRHTPCEPAAGGTGREARAEAAPSEVTVSGTRNDRDRDAATDGLCSGSDREREVRAPAMTASRHDDNAQYNRFLTFLAENESRVVYSPDISERLIILLEDKDGNSLPNCSVEVRSARTKKTLSRTVTYADGRTLFFPADASPAGESRFAVHANCGGENRTGHMARFGRRHTKLKLPVSRTVPRRLPVDIAILLDITGSMQGQNDRLQAALQRIHDQLVRLPSRPEIRFALVASGNRDGNPITRGPRFTGDVAELQAVLDRLDAGGGDAPKDLQAALAAAMHHLDWRTGGVRLGFIVSDAPPHTDHGQDYTYESAMRDSLQRGIKWCTVGADGLGRDGEVILRQIAQFTMGEYVFISQGGDDAEGRAGEAGHHVGSNYSAENLDEAIVRIVRREVSYFTDRPHDFRETIVATATTDVPRDRVLAPAVAELLRRLADRSSLRLEDATPVAVLPVDTVGRESWTIAEYISEQLRFAASRHPTFRVIERDLRAVGQELKLQLRDMFDAAAAVPVGRLVGAEVLIVSKLKVHSRGATLFARLIRVETGEVLSVAKVEMDERVLRSS